MGESMFVPIPPIIFVSHDSHTGLEKDCLVTHIYESKQVLQNEQKYKWLGINGNHTCIIAGQVTKNEKRVIVS
jgi:hypothetical protein